MSRRHVCRLFMRTRPMRRSYGCMSFCWFLFAAKCTDNVLRAPRRLAFIYPFARFFIVCVFSSLPSLPSLSSLPSLPSLRLLHSLCPMPFFITFLFLPFLFFPSFLALFALSLVFIYITTNNNKYIYLSFRLCAYMCARACKERGKYKAQKKSGQNSRPCMLP